MISFDDTLQCLECGRCGRQREVSRAMLGDPERYIEAMEAMQAQHTDCKQMRSERRPGGAVVRVWQPPTGAQAWARMSASLRRQMAA